MLEVFDRLGGTMPIDDGDEFEAIFTAMGTVAPFFEYLHILSDFLVSHGLPAQDARQVVAGTYTGLLEQLTAHESPDFAELVKEHAPPGGGNDQLTTLMREEGVFDAMTQAVEEVHRRLTGADS